VYGVWEAEGVAVCGGGELRRGQESRSRLLIDTGHETLAFQRLGMHNC
jgi:hypothetical protein